MDIWRNDGKIPKLGKYLEFTQCLPQFAFVCGRVRAFVCLFLCVCKWVLCVYVYLGVFFVCLFVCVVCVLSLCARLCVCVCERVTVTV